MRVVCCVGGGWVSVGVCCGVGVGGCVFWGGQACWCWLAPPFFWCGVWRFPTLPQPLGCSTIGVLGLSFQVRNGAGRFPKAMTTTQAYLVVFPDRVGAPLLLFVWGGVGLFVDRIVVAGYHAYHACVCCVC